MKRNMLLAAALAAALAFTVLTRVAGQPAGGAGLAAGSAARGNLVPATPPGQPAAPPAGTGGKASAATSPADRFFTPRRLVPGQQPPQFVIVSFDGAGSHQKWEYWQSVGRASGARFTAFLSGVYLLDAEHRTEYHGPGHRVGRSALGYWFDADQVRRLVTDLNRAWSAGDEIGTHFNGHFCANARPGADDWSTSQWNDELDQFFRFLAGYRALDHLPDAPDLLVPRAEIRGARTPCLQGRPAELLPALRQHGFDYDSSQVSRGISWPRKTSAGVWELPVAYVPIAGPGPGAGSGVIAMDYNFWVKQTGSPPTTGHSLADADQVLHTYRNMYQATYSGNRAPLVLANHFNSWNDNAYTIALSRFVRETCGKPETYCVPYRDVIRWMELQRPATLAALQARPAVYSP